MCVLQKLGVAGAFVAAGFFGTAATSSAAVVPIFQAQQQPALER